MRQASELIFADSKHEQRRVVVPVAATELGGRAEDQALHGRRGQTGVFLQYLEQAGFAKFLALGVIRLGHAVREEQQAVAGRKTHVFRRKGLKRKNAEYSPAGLQSLMRSVAVQKNRRIVPGVGVSQHTSRAVELRVKKCNEAVASGVVADQRIQPRAQTLGRQSGRSE